MSVSVLDWQLIVLGPSGAVLLQQGSWWCCVSHAVLTGVQPVQAISEVATHMVRGTFTDSTLAKYYACTAGFENHPRPWRSFLFIYLFFIISFHHEQTQKKQDKTKQHYT